MVETHSEFVRRLKHIGRKHTKMANGYTTRVGKDGLIVIKPRRARRGSPVVMMLILAVCFFGFKAFLLTAIGPATYDERLGKLADGNIVEQAGALMMSADLLTVSLSEMMAPLLRHAS